MQPHEALPETVDKFIRIINDEEVLHQILDPSASPEETVGRKLNDERLMHIIESIWPREADGLSSSKRNRLRKWKPYLQVIQLRLRGSPVKSIAEKLELHQSSVYRK